ncbi:exosortase-associated EpsI family protein [Prosthecobacter sp.]|uniref:exosortase-associated EpsI family protein n=1 Tax=Prosthecobacter sp. TaxID=1965333 RepID=UPI002ABBB9AE|nr:exosortase-associated EpsI family protein [Prosthecobacter sp.]MDZ4406205.1 exosortase-associated EpsI family protein [Prosthecobacter sp.]
MIARAFILFALCGMTMLLCQFSPQAKGGDEAGVLAELPMVAGSFVGESEPPSDKERALLPADTIIVKRAYRTPGRSVENRDLAHASLVIAGNDSRSIHRPEVCLDGQGWTVTDSRVREVKLISGGVLRVRDLAIEREVLLDDGTKLPLRAHYVYWFVGVDVSTPSNLERQMLSLRDSVLHNVNHRWAYPSVMARVTDNLTPQQSGERRRNDEETVEMILSLIRSLAPRLQKDLMPHS